jgi:hypothetical protein
MPSSARRRRASRRASRTKSPARRAGKSPARRARKSPRRASRQRRYRASYVAGTVQHLLQRSGVASQPAFHPIRMSCDENKPTFYCTERAGLIELLFPKAEATYFDPESPPSMREVTAGQLEALHNLGVWLLGTKQEEPPLVKALMMTDAEVKAAIETAVHDGYNVVADHPYFTALSFVLAVLVHKYRSQNAARQAQEEKIMKLEQVRDRLRKHIVSLGKEKMDSAKELAIVRAQLEAVFAIQGQTPPALPAPPAPSPSPP